MNKEEHPFEQKNCPRCGTVFICSASSKCWCFEYDIPPATMDFIQDKWQGCLCPECLKSFSRQG